MNRKEAADFLGVSEKTVSRHVNSGKIAAHRVGGSLDISTKELEAFKAQMSALLPVVPLAITTSETGDKTGQEPVSQEGTERSLARFSGRAAINEGGMVLVFESAEAVRELSQALAGQGTGQDKAVPLADKKTLSLAEAAHLSGVAESILRAAVKDERLRAVKIGRAKRVLQADLDEFISALFSTEKR